MPSKKKALVIGVNYEDTPEARLRGCQNDALRAKEYLINVRGYAKEDVVLALDRDGGGSTGSNAEGTTRSGIIEGILRLANASNRDRLEEVFIHYSGHGTQVRDPTYERNEQREEREEDGLDEALVPSDFRRNGLIRDDKLNTLFQEFHPDTKVVCVFDCCHSGTMGDLPWKYRPTTDHRAYDTREERKEKEKEKENEEEKEEEKETEKREIDALEVRSGCRTPCSVVCLSGCRDDQVSMDAFNVAGQHRYSGAMTSNLMKVLLSDESERKGENKSPTLHDLLLRLHENLRRGNFRQKPVLTSSVRLDLNQERF